MSAESDKQVRRVHKIGLPAYCAERNVLYEFVGYDDVDGPDFGAQNPLLVALVIGLCQGGAFASEVMLRVFDVTVESRDYIEFEARPPAEFITQARFDYSDPAGIPVIAIPGPAIGLGQNPHKAKPGHASEVMHAAVLASLLATEEDLDLRDDTSIHDPFEDAAYYVLSFYRVKVLAGLFALSEPLTGDSFDLDANSFDYMATKLKKRLAPRPANPALGRHDMFVDRRSIADQVIGMVTALWCTVAGAAADYAVAQIPIPPAALESIHWDTQVGHFWAEMRDTLVKLPRGSFPPTQSVEAVVGKLAPMLHRWLIFLGFEYRLRDGRPWFGTVEEDAGL
ncbi:MULTISPECIES: hypothetical protein [unclassified Frondihabitans]|uniref:hypothetical protein n=1 Tax=unclassified Frondihabitans TaxID=2626248 RepID=UPI000F4FEE36|nr:MULTISPECIES: hypothetical protein [unclassified Frondihabitans]RPE77862.1 hypothetical protein EDF37_0527 [Frondihabitans sp. PhB153]RPF08141.1 hypothetical protein EDF39_0528 [Frondihabitans sp. PhB161]